MFDQEGIEAQDGSSTGFDADAAPMAGLAAEGMDVRAVLGVLGAAAGVDVSGADEEELCAAAANLEQARRYLDAAQAHVLAELDARNVTDRARGLRTSTWLAEIAKLPSGVASQRVRTATKLRRVLPDADAALSEGRIGFDHARVLADAANPRIDAEFPSFVGPLCDAAAHMEFHKWRREVEGVAELLDQDGPHDPNDDLARNRLRLSPTGDTVAFVGDAVGEHAQIISQGLNTIADELFGRFSRDNEVTAELAIPNRATLLCLALSEAVTRALGVELGSSKPPRVVANLVLSPDDLHRHRDCTCGDTPGRPGGVNEHALFDTGVQPGGLRLQHTPTGLVVTDAHGRRLRSDTHAPMLCDPDIYTLVVDSLGVPLDMGRLARFATPTQRRALAHRDGGCTFTGCTAPPTWTDAHHRKPWKRGGNTDLRDLLSLCRHHHGVAHRNGWRLDITHDGWSLWTTPDGHQFWGQRHHEQRAGPVPTSA